MGDRNKLMQEINFGMKLRPTKTVDKSRPIIQVDGEKLKSYVAHPQQQQQSSALPPPPPPPSCLPNGHGKSVPNGKHATPSPQMLNSKQKLPPQNGKAVVSRDALLEEIKNVGGRTLKKVTPAAGVVHNGKAVSRDALLEEIKNGRQLKKVQTVDKTVVNLQGYEQNEEIKPNDQRSPPVSLKPKSPPVMITPEKDTNDDDSPLSSYDTPPMSPPPSATMVTELLENITQQVTNYQKASPQTSPNPFDNSSSRQAKKVEPLPIVDVQSNVTECDIPKVVLVPSVIKNGNYQPDDESLVSCQPAITTNMPPMLVELPKHEKIPDEEEFGGELQTPKLLRSFEPAFRSSMDSEPFEEDKPHLKAAHLLTKILKEKLEKSPQPNYPLKKPINNDSDMKEFLKFASSLCSPTEKPICPPSVPPPAIPRSEFAGREFSEISPNACQMRPNDVERLAETPAEKNIKNGKQELIHDHDEPDSSNRLIYDGNSKNLRKEMSDRFHESAALFRKVSDAQAANMVQPQREHTQPSQYTATVVQPREHIIHVQRIPAESSSFNDYEPPQMVVKNNVPRGFPPSEQNVQKNMQNPAKNGTLHDDTNLHKAKMVQPREHIIEIKRIPAQSSHQNEGPSHNDNGYSSKNQNGGTSYNENGYGSKNQNGGSSYNENGYGSKTLPRRIHAGGSPAAFPVESNFNPDGFAQAALRQLDDQNYHYIRHNSDPNLLDLDDSGSDSSSGIGMFRKVYPNVSQLRNRFEYKNDEISSTKSSPTEQYPPQIFVCKPAVAIPIPPSSGPQVVLSSTTNHGGERITKFSQPVELVRKLSSASESSFSSVDMSSPRSSSTSKRENHVDKFLDSQNYTGNGKVTGRTRADSVPHAMYTAHPVLMGSTINGSSPKSHHIQVQQITNGDDVRRGSSPSNWNGVPMATWKVKKESIPQTVNKYAVSRTLEDMHNRQFEAANTSDTANRHHQIVHQDSLFGDRLDSEVANIVGLSLDDLKQFRFQIDLNDPEGAFLQLKKLYQQQQQQQH